MRQISLCITNYNRYDLLIESFKHVLQCPEINEIVIVDDASDMDIFAQIKSFCESIPKIRLYRNRVNQGCYQNKMLSVSYAINKWCIVFDSDNIIKPDYINELYKIPEWHEHLVYSPDWAMPAFSYVHFGGQTITRENVVDYIGKLKFETLINCMNYVVNRDQYLRVFDHTHREPWAADSIIQNYNWLNSGNGIYVVPEMRYEHRIHPGSHFSQHQGKSLVLAGIYEEKLKQLR